MSSSPKSEATIVLCRNRWFVEGTEVSVPSIESGEAAESLFTHWSDRRESPPRRLRLIYEPAWISHAAVSCPQGSRTMLRRILESAHPALADAANAFACATLGNDPQGSETILSHESSPWLGAFRAAMGDRLIGAWPLHVVTRQLAREALAIVAVSQQTIVCPHDGLPRLIDDPEERETFLQGLAVGDAGRVVWVSDEPAPATGEPGQTATIADLCRVARELPVHHLSNFIEPEPRWPAAAAAIGGTLALAGALGLAAWTGYSIQQSKELARQQAARIDALNREIAILGANRDRIEMLRPFAGEPVVPIGPLLRRLSLVTPPDIQLGSLQVTADGFSLSGRSVPGDPTAASASFEHFARVLSEGTGWTVAVVGDVPPGFTLQGRRTSP